MPALPNTELPENVQDLPAPKTLNRLVATVKSCIRLGVEDGTIPTPERGDPGPEGPIGEPGPEGPRGADGIVARSLPWEPRFYEAGQTVTHLAGLWQATAGTDEEPGIGEQWTCLSRGIVDAQLDDAHQLILRYSDQTTQVLGNVQGPPGREWIHRGTYDGSGATWYLKGDVVITNGSGYVCTADSGAGPCPGADWKMLCQAKAKVGKRGPEGLPGPTGARGATGAPGVQWKGQHVAGWSYNAGDLVRKGSSVFICMEATHEPPTADSPDWDLFVSAA